MSNDRLLSNKHGLCQAMFSNEQNQKDLIKYPFLRCWTWSFEYLMRFFWLTSKRYFCFIKLSVSVESSTCIKTVTCHTNIFLVTSIKFVCSEVTKSSRSSRMTWAFLSTLYQHNVILLSWCLDTNSWRIFRCHSDMCIPVHISLVICVSLQYGCQWNVYPLPPTPPNKCRFYFCCFCEFCESSSKGLQMIQDYEQHNRQKSNDSRQNNRKAVSGEFTSSWAAMLM